ncbi:transglycosylase family protein [Bounagaea algeriensis]
MRNDGDAAGPSRNTASRNTASQNTASQNPAFPESRGRAVRASGRTALAAVFALCAGAVGPALGAQANPGAAGGTAAAERAAEQRSAVWDRLAECEAGGNWQANTGNGYYGGLQFDASTWRAYNGDRFAGYAHNATREQQISVGEAVRADRGGYGAWPACSRKLGLPR